MRSLRATLCPLLPLLAFMLLSGCLAYRLTEFTDQTRKTDELSIEELQRLTFYTSHKLILTTVNQVRESPTGGLLRKQLLDTRYVDQVVIRRHTPGVAITASEGYLEVSFEAGAWLRFNLMPSGRYLLNAETVMYGDQLYRVECVPRRFQDCPVSLLVRKSVKPRIAVRSQRVRGLQP